jgi:hypothetical protein
MQHMKRDDPVHVIRSPLRGIARAWISDNPTIGYVTAQAARAPQASGLATRQAAERRRYIAERARAFAAMAAAQQRLDASEQALHREIEARIERLWRALQRECAVIEGVNAEAREPARRQLSLQVLLALMVIGETRMALERYRREDAPVTAERLRALEEHAAALAEALARLLPGPGDASDLT